MNLVFNLLSDAVLPSGFKELHFCFCGEERAGSCIRSQLLSVYTLA